MTHGRTGRLDALIAQQWMPCSARTECVCSVGPTCNRRQLHTVACVCPQCRKAGSDHSRPNCRCATHAPSINKHFNCGAAAPSMSASHRAWAARAFAPISGSVQPCTIRLATLSSAPLIAPTRSTKHHTVCTGTQSDGEAKPHGPDPKGQGML